MKRSTHRVALVLFTGLVVFAGGAALRIRYLLTGGGAYAHVASIAGTREYQDPALLEKAWQLPVAAIYRREGIDWQHNPSFCGPTSVVNVLRSLGDTADQATVLSGTPYRTVLGLLPGGMTLDEVAALLRQKSGKRVEVLRDLDLPAFRAQMAHANDPSRRYVVNLHRGPLFGKGGGHFSPIAGYLAAEDLVLVLDVNQSYQPWLVKTERLFSAVDTLDTSIGRKRGLVVLEE